MRGARERPWWRDAVVYQVYPRSFADGNGDGVGDLSGLLARADYLRWLGVDGVWLSPVHPSPFADGGYDVVDYCDVDPLFGDLALLDRVLAELHARGIRLLLDWVPNHTSDRHPWFVESRSSRTSAKRDWYVWREGPPDRPPNNWRSAFGGPAWTFDEGTRQWYLHLFLPEQPDLNWANPGVVDAMHGTLRFWLGRGIDGFRMDVVHLIGKDSSLADQPPEFGEVDRVGIHDYEGTHELIRGIRAVLDAFPGERMMVGEVNLRETLRIATYYGTGDELHLAFNFLSLDAGWEAAAWRGLVELVGRDLGADAWPTWVLSNHDVPRHRTRFDGSEKRARAAAVLLLTLRGTPFLYAGEELGLEDAEVSVEDASDPGGRDGCRAPIPWTASAPHGWDGGRPWLPFPRDAEDRSVEGQRDDPRSILTLYRRALELRRGSEALRAGTLELLQQMPEEVLAFERRADGERLIVLVNFGERDVPIAMPDARVVLSSEPDEWEPRPGRCVVPGEAALVLRAPAA